MVYFEDLLKDSWISHSKTKAFDPVHCLQKSNSFNNISCEHQDTGEMTNYLLLYFKVHLYLKGMSKLAQAWVLLQVNKRLLIHCIWESQQLPDSNQLLNFVFYLLILQGSQQGSMSSSCWPCWQSKILIPSGDTFWIFYLSTTTCTVV